MLKFQRFGIRTRSLQAFGILHIETKRNHFINPIVRLANTKVSGDPVTNQSDVDKAKSLLSEASEVVVIEETKENEADKFINSLINRGDFYGVRPRNDAKPVHIEASIGKLKNMLDANFKITAEYFVRTILIPLKENDPAIVEIIKKAESSYIPYFIRCCGLPMSDVTEEQKLLILENLLKAFKANGFKFHIESYNAILAVWLENGCEFDVDKIMDEVEINQKLQPDLEFYNKLLRKLAETGQIKHIKKLLLKMNSQGILPDTDSDLAQVFAYSVNGHKENANRLVAKILDKYGVSMKADCLSEQIRGALANVNDRELRNLLRSAIVFADTIMQDKSNKMPVSPNRKMLIISSDDMFEFIWKLAKLSPMGQNYAGLTQQILETAQRKVGFFKILMREAERHIAHGYYYSATVLLSDTMRLNNQLKDQRKDYYIKHLLPRLANHMVRNRVEPDVINDIANRIIVSHGPWATFYHDLAYSILNFKGYTFDERFTMFSNFVDAIDPDRTRTHLILPLLMRCPTLQDKKTILFQCSQIGYTNIARISPFIMTQLFYEPMLNMFLHKTRWSDQKRLDVTSKVLESYDIKPEETWNSLYDYVKDVEAKKYKFSLPIRYKNFIRWLQDEQEKMTEAKRVAAVEKNVKYTYSLFKKLLSYGDIEKMHSFLIQRGSFPSETDFDKDLDPLIHLYLSHANFGYLKKFLQILSNVKIEEESLHDDDYKQGYDPATVSPVKNYHLLNILRRFYMDCKNLPLVIEYVYELKRLFPYAISFVESRFESSRAYEKLFSSIFASENFQLQNVNECIDLLTGLIKLDIITLHATETLTLYIIERVNLRFGWDAAVDTWLKFQSSLYCSNGILALMKFAVENDDNSQIQFLLHRAKNFISSSRVNAFLAAAYLVNGKHTDANKIFEKERTSMLAFDCRTTFQLLLQQGAKEGVLEFADLCLEYSDLKNDEKCSKAFINHWIFFCGGRRQLQDALMFYELFRKHGVYLDQNQMEKLNNILVRQQEIFEKWAHNPKTAILNTPKKVGENEFVRKMKRFQEDLEVIRSGGTLVPRTEDNFIAEIDLPLPTENRINA